MPVLRMQGGSIISPSSGVLGEADACCCGGDPTCPACGCPTDPSDGCVYCCPSGTSDERDVATPITYEISFSGVTMQTACCHQAASLSSKVNSGSLNTATITLTTGTSQCIWTYDESAGPFTVDASSWASNDCTGTELTCDGFDIYLERQAANWFIYVRCRINTGNPQYLFRGLIAATDGDCCQSHEFQNLCADIDCDGTNGCDGGNYNLGYGGTATITPCA